MELADAETLARHLMTQFKLTLAGWRFGWNRRKRSLGLCRYHEKRIELSLHFVKGNDAAQVRETLLHEIAHALAGEKAGHGPQWKAQCALVGCKPERCDRGVAVMPKGRWCGRCPTCAKEYWRHRRPARRARYWCRVCGPEKGAVTFSNSPLSTPTMPPPPMPAPPMPAPQPRSHPLVRTLQGLLFGRAS